MFKLLKIKFLGQLIITSAVVLIAAIAIFFFSADRPKDSLLTQDAGIIYDQSSTISYWQTYEGSPYLGIHQYLSGDYDFQIEKITKPSPDFHTGYAFIHDGNLIFEDRANWKQYTLQSNGNFKKIRKPSFARGVYKSQKYQFLFDNKSGIVSACLISDNRHCSSIDIHPSTFPYVFAAKNNSVITISNWGEALLFKDGLWCRMQMSNDLWACEKPEPDILQRPRKIQFYSSVLFQSRVLLGEWPTGRIYEFDGSTLKPSSMTPPFIEKQVLNRLGYEAQSMAEYCGDLFIGYWPKGEVWRWNHLNEKWSLFHRFFTELPNEDFIPHANRKSDDLDSAFFGQRITSLVPFDNSLYVATSNLNVWSSKIQAQKIIGESRAAEYGAIYKITRHGCKSTYFDLKQ